MDEQLSKTGRLVAKGAAWTVLMRFSVRAIGLVSTVILARLLLPEDFGLIALATMFVALLEIVSEFHFNVFLIRERNIGRRHYDTVWTLTIGRAVVTAIGVALVAPYAASFFDEPRLETVLYALAGATMIGAFANVGIVDFQKDMAFDKDFRFLLRPKMVSFCVTVLFAVIWRNYWALVAGILSTHIARLVLSYSMHPFRPRPSLAHAGDIMRFSKWLLLNNVLAFVNQRSDYFIIGKFLNAATVGIYSVAHEISALISTELIAPIHRALLPGFSQLAHDPKTLRRAFIEGQAVIIMLALPLAAGIGLTAEPLVHTALGAKWTGAIILIQILAIDGIAKVCRASAYPFMLAAGRPHLTTVISGFSAVVGVAALLVGTANWGVVGAAWAVAGASVAQLVVNYIVVARAFGFTLADTVPAFWRSFAACGVMAAAVWELQNIWPRPETFADHLAELIVSVLAGAAVYTGTHLTLWLFVGQPAGAERRVLSLAKDGAARLMARRAIGKA